MARDKERAELSAARATVALVVGLAAGFAFVLFPYGIGWVIASARGEMPSSFTAVSGFTNGLTLLFPMVQGFALALALGRGNYPFMRVEMLLLALTAIELVGAFFFLREGIICLIILTPLIVGMMSLGAVLGRFLARRARSLTAQVSLVPLVVLAVFAEAAGPKPNYPGVVVDSVTIDAPAPYVWRYVVDYPENTSPPDVVAVGRAIRDALVRLRTHVGDAAYNLVFHTAPHHHEGPFHWHVHIVPRLTSLAGFEQGTGVMINIVAPELAARHLAG